MSKLSRVAHPCRAAERQQTIATGVSPWVSGVSNVQRRRRGRFLRVFRPSGAGTKTTPSHALTRVATVCCRSAAQNGCGFRATSVAFTMLTVERNLYSYYPKPLEPYNSKLRPFRRSALPTVRRHKDIGAPNHRTGNLYRIGGAQRMPLKQVYSAYQHFVDCLDYRDICKVRFQSIPCQRILRGRYAALPSPAAESRYDLGKTENGYSKAGGAFENFVELVTRLVRNVALCQRR